jgi:uncharacterized membrane protein
MRGVGGGEVHPAPDTQLDVLRTAALGITGGLRSLMPFALLSAHLEREGADIADGGWALDALASPIAVAAVSAMALGEIIADKLPMTPSRLEPLPLAGRVVLGGTACAFAGLAEGRRSDTGALVGSVGVLAGSLLGYGLRTRLPVRLPSLILALTEDVLAFTLGRWALQH